MYQYTGNFFQHCLIWPEQTDGRAVVRGRDARLILDVACSRDQGLGSVVEEPGPSKKFELLTARTSFYWSTWQSRSRKVSWYFPGSAASYSAIGRHCAAQRREVSGATSSAEKHNVLDPNGTSEDVAGRRG